MKAERIMVPDEVSETVTVVPLPNRQENYAISFLDFVAMKRFQEGVRFGPCLTPVLFRDTIVCYSNSTRKRFISKTNYEPRNKPRRFTESLIIFPKRPQKSFVTFVDYHIDECRKWFKTSMEFKATTYTTRKIIPKNLTDENENVQREAKLEPGASQVFLPRYDKNPIRNREPVQVFVNGDAVMNGY